MGEGKSIMIVNHNSSPENDFKKMSLQVRQMPAIPTFRGLRQEDSLGYISDKPTYTLRF